MSTILAFLTAVGAGAIIAASIAHLTTISNFRQAWINSLRDDVAEFFKSLQAMKYAFQDMNYATQDTMQTPEKSMEKLQVARLTVLFLYERIRLRLNWKESAHIELEAKLREFIDNPLSEMLADRSKIDQTADLARSILKTEWDVTKYPWRGWGIKLRATPAD